MIPVWLKKVSICPAETDFIPPLNEEIKFQPRRAGQFFT